MGKIIGIILFVAAIWFVADNMSGRLDGGAPMSATEPSAPKSVLQRAKASVQDSMDQVEDRYRSHERRFGSD